MTTTHAHSLDADDELTELDRARRRLEAELANAQDEAERQRIGAWLARIRAALRDAGARLVDGAARGAR